jgi:hypothetical protein
VISLQPTVSLAPGASCALDSRAVDDVFWLRVVSPDSQWRQQFPKIWQLVNEFDICILERLRQASLIGTTDFVLATRTSCSNGFRVITGHCYLSPAFNQLEDMEFYLGEYLVDLLHIHFFGNAEMEPDIALG